MIKIGEKATENVAYDKFIGYAKTSIVAINPTSAEIEALGYNKPETEPKYTSFDTNNIKQARIEFWLKFECDGEAKIVRKNIWLKQSSWKNKDQTKTQCIDDYGNTGWLTKEQFEGKESQPEYSKLIGKFRVAYMGEEQLVDWVRNWLNVKQSHKWDNNTKKFVPIADDDLCNAELSIDIKKFFNGDFRELKFLVTKNTADYQFLSLFTIRQVDGKEYQDVYNKTLKLYQSPTYWSTLRDKALKAGLESNIVTMVIPVMKYESVSIASKQSTQQVQQSTIPSSTPDFSESTDDLPF